MVSPISANTAVASIVQTQVQQQSKPAAPSAPQDSVHVSKQTLAATGDVDHDGDSH